MQFLFSTLARGTRWAEHRMRRVWLSLHGVCNYWRITVTPISEYAEDLGEYLEIGPGWRHLRHHVILNTRGRMTIESFEVAANLETDEFFVLSVSSPEVLARMTVTAQLPDRVSL